MYAARYNVPNKTGISLELRHCVSSDQCSEAEAELKKLNYDYPLSDALHKNAAKLSQPREEDPLSKTKTPSYYHALERMEDLPFKEPNQEVSPVPQRKAPYYHVLEGPGDLDAPDSHVNNKDHHGLLKESMPKALKSSEGKEFIDEAHDTEAYYHVLEEAETSETQDDCGYKELQSNRVLDTEYQSLHKYTYVDSAEMRHK